MEINKRILLRLLEEAKMGSPSGSCSYTRSYFLISTLPGIVRASHERETGEKVSLEEISVLAYMCVEAGFVHIPPGDGDDNDDLLPAEKMLRLTLQGYEKLESLKEELE